MSTPIRRPGLFAFATAGLLLSGPPTSTMAKDPEQDSLAKRIESTVSHLADDSFRGRLGPDAVRAGRWVAGQFADLGVAPLFDGSYEQLIPDTDGGVKGINIGGVIVGQDADVRDEYVIVSGHHDHLGVIDGRIYNGANDNASAVAMVLEAARHFTKHRPRRSVILVSFDLEEQMLWGSRYFVANPPIDLDSISLFLTADMIGRPLGGLPLNDVFVIGAESGDGVAEVVAAKAETVGQNVLRLGADIVGTRSDYGPFRDRDVPFLFFSTGENPDYHTPRDTAEKINYELAAGITRLMIGVAADVANAPKRIIWSDEPPRDLSDAVTMKRVCEVVLAVEKGGHMELGLVERVLVNQTLQRTTAIVEAGTLTASDRRWLIRSAQAMLLTLF